MVSLPVPPMSLPNKYWPFYTNDSGDEKYVDLAGYAGNFESFSGYVSSDCLRAI